MLNFNPTELNYDTAAAEESTVKMNYCLRNSYNCWTFKECDLTWTLSTFCRHSTCSVVDNGWTERRESTSVSFIDYRTAAASWWRRWWTEEDDTSTIERASMKKGREKISKQLALCVTITTLCEFINLNVILQEKQRVESSVQFQHVLARQRYFIFIRKSHLSCRRW